MRGFVVSVSFHSLFVQSFDHFLLVFLCRNASSPKSHLQKERKAPKEGHNGLTWIDSITRVFDRRRSLRQRDHSNVDDERKKTVLSLCQRKETSQMRALIEERHWDFTDFGLRLGSSKMTVRFIGRSADRRGRVETAIKGQKRLTMVSRWKGDSGPE
jgi:hypothetical protein